MIRKTEGMVRQAFLDMERAEPIWVCQTCLNDYMLKMLSGALQEERLCRACGKATRSALTPEHIARFIREHLPKYFQPDQGLYPGHKLTLDDVVSKAIGCSSEIVVRAISSRLEDSNANEEAFYWSGQEYCRTPSPFESEDHQRGYVTSNWHRIAEGLTHGWRFFNDTARIFFEQLIEEAMEATAPNCPETPALFTVIDAGTVFYRSRIASDEREARAFTENAATELGVAPKERAANNRMSPAGIPLLYVSREIDTCIAEVRPSIGDNVVVGGFQSTVPLKFFDFTKLSRQLRYAPLSLFDPSYQTRSEHRMLLEYLHEEIARPVRASGTEYVATQALAEFIRYDKKWAFDGIAFQSVQCDGGVNYVLFDRGPPEAINVPNWRPTFHLGISTDSVSLHVIESVSYGHKPKSISK